MRRAPAGALRICFLVFEKPTPGRPGPSEIVWDMSQELVALGHEVHVVTPAGSEPLGNTGLHVHHFQVPPTGYRWFLGHLWIAKRMSVVARSIGPDVVHAPEYLSTAVLTTLEPHIPTVLTVPGNIFQRLAVPGGNQASYFYTELTKWAARTSAKRCAAIIAMTREMKQWWEWTGSLPERTIYIPYGVDTHHFRPLPDARHELGLPADSLMLLYVGRLDREKGLFDALAALAELRNTLELDHLRLEIIGDGPLRQDLERAVVQENLQGVVYLRGPLARDELPVWYSAADALLLPSWIEPFGRVILEAMACGIPVLSTRTGGPSDHVLDGVNGFLFPPRDPGALAELLRSVIAKPSVLREMRPKALAYVKQNLSWKRIVERIVNEVYLPIVGGYTRVPEAG
jgi:glycosyltransferase involved in cell wall biosynthesis